MESSGARDYFVDLQTRIVARLEALDGTGFGRDVWERKGGGGVTCIIEQGEVFGRGGVNSSHVRGGELPASATAARPQLAGRAFEVMGVSLVLHPRNPYAPTVHMNVRLFVALPRVPGVGITAGNSGAADEGDKVAAPDFRPIWWFGGGMDLTPYYGFEEDATHFHRSCRDALSPSTAAYHLRYNRMSDESFFFLHRPFPGSNARLSIDSLSYVDLLARLA